MRQKINSGREITSPADQLRSLALLVEAIGPEGFTLATAIRHVLDAKGALTMDSLLGLAPAPGGEPWHVTEWREDRNRLLRQLGEFLATGRLVAEKAREVSRRLRHYTATWRRRDSSLDACPYDPTTSNAILFEIFNRSRGRAIPTGLSQLRAILA